MVGMRRSRIAVVAGLGLFFVFPSILVAQSAPATRIQAGGEKQSLADWKSGMVLGDIQGTANYHSIVVDKGKIADVAAIDSIRADAGFLRSKWQAGADKNQIPPAYLDQLKADQELLNRASNPDVPDDQRTSIRSAVAEDLNIKSLHAKASPPDEWASLVHVDINTVKNGTIVGNHAVWYVAKGWAEVPNKWTQCGNLSSPAKADLPPGAYLMRVDNTAQIPLKVGGNGKKQQTIELQAQ
jgi:hypothetical protein